MTIKLFSEKKVGGLMAILFGFLSLHEGKTLFPYSKNILTGDHAFPGFIGILLIIFGLGLFFERKIEEEKSKLPTGKTRLILISSIVILFIYCYFIMVFGYVFSTLVVSICLIKAIGNYRWIFSVLLGVVITVILYFFFIALLKIPFPSGYISF